VSTAELDVLLRQRCFAALGTLQARFGDDVPYRSGLDAGFAFDGERVPFLNYQKGIYRSRRQRGPAALSVNTSYASPYADERTTDGFRYDYRAGSLDQPDNHALRAAAASGVPLVYFVGTRPGWYRPIFPTFVTADDPIERRVLLVPATLSSIGDPELPSDDPIERRYAIRDVVVRLHQARFRGLVVPAYRDRCAICRLKELRLLDAAHIASDSSDEGIAAIRNGLSLCSIHHRAYDQDLVGISPDYEVHVAPRLLEDEDGPMLELLKTFHRSPIEVPANAAWRPDRERLAARFERFAAA
jgi:putative restriction endonuclease